MKRLVSITAIAALLAFTGCKSGAEKRADSAWKASQTLTAGEKLMKQKEAYIFYKQAMEQQKDKASTELKNNFISAALARIEFIHEAEGGKAQAILFIREEIDKIIDNEEIVAASKDEYSTFIMKLADDARAEDDLSLCMSHLETAITHAADKSVPESMKNDISKEFSADQLALAQDLYENGKKAKNVEDIIRAEYYAHVVLNYDADNADAKALLSKTRKILLSVYTAFPSVIEHKPDTALYNRIDTTDILMAIPVVSAKGSKVTMQVNIYNYSYNAIRLKKENFYIRNDKGQKYKATALKTDKKLLDTEFETKMTLSFRKPAGKIKELVYESERDGDKHFAPKYFY